jgi:ribosomal protein L11 methyltransferase
MSWIEIKATFDQSPEDWSPFIEAFRDFGCENTIQSDFPPSLGAAMVDVEGAAEQIEELKARLLELGAKDVESAPLIEQNWDEIWRQHFHPRRIGNRFVVRPTWEEFEAKPDDLILVLDPGQAFGTGDHPTTRMCLELMEGLDHAGKRVADVGCGSGILSIAAQMLGAAEVAGVDIEPVAIEVAKENAERHGMDLHFVAGSSIRDLGEGPWDIVLSNIISATLIAMGPSIVRETAPGASWIVSGIIEENWPDVVRAAERLNCTLVRDKHEDGWVAAEFRCP